MRHPIERRRSVILAALLIWAVAGLSGSGTARGAAAPDSKLSGAVAEILEDLLRLKLLGEPVPLIVQTWSAPTSLDLLLVRTLGGTVGRTFKSINGFSARVPAGNVLTLAASLAVERLSFDWKTGGLLDVASAATGAAGGAFASSLTGKGVTIAVLDSGMAPVDDLRGEEPALIAEVDLVEPDFKPADPFGHGTHVAGIIAGSGAGSAGAGAFRTFRGLAPGARLVSVKVLGEDGFGTVGNILAGVDWVLRNQKAYAIRVMNLSLGHPIDESYRTDPLCRAVERAWRAGIAVVVSAGNYGGRGYASVTSPGNDPLVITAGAGDDGDTAGSADDEVAPFSSLGPTSLDGVVKPDLVAPGVAIVSLRSPGSYIDDLLPGQVLPYSDYTAPPPQGDGPSPYVSLSGTSMAAPMVSGAAALLLDQDPSATPSDLKARLMVGARKVDDEIVRRGAGFLDVEASLRLGAEGLRARRSDSPRLLVREEPDGTESVRIQEVGEAWGDPAAWSSEQVWGDVAIWGARSQWMDTAVWGEVAIWGSARSSQSYEGQVAIWGSR